MKLGTTLAGVVVLLILTNGELASQEVKVDGHVHDSTGNAIAGVKVSLYSTGKKDAIDTVRTDDNGHYTLSRKIESTYDMMFSHSKLDLATVELLAENKNQHINIKMYKRGEKRSASAYHEALQASERLLFTIVSLPPAERGGLMGEYKASGAMELVHSKAEMPLSDSPSEQISRFFGEKRELLKKLDRDTGGK
jgi:hypothetical protein